MMLKMAFTNTRGFNRLKAQYLVKYRLGSPGVANPRANVASLRDIGGGGVLFRSTESLPVSGLVDLEINFVPSRKVIKARARILRVRRLLKGRSYEVGASFVNMMPRDQRDIVRHVDRASPGLALSSKGLIDRMMAQLSRPPKRKLKTVFDR